MNAPAHECNPVNSRHCEICQLVKDYAFVVTEMERLERAYNIVINNMRKYRNGLEKIAEAERMGYGTQRTYGQMAIDALKQE